MLSMRARKAVFGLGVFFLLLVLFSKFTQDGQKDVRTFLAVGGEYNTGLYLMIILPLLIMLAVNILNLLRSDKVLRGITLAVNILGMAWGIILYYALAANASLKSTPALFFIIAGAVFFFGALMAHPDYDEE
ncbi:MAG: hypothetical protein ACOX3P_06895 [Saccharofermentanales bacterium]|nr:hypothetical protein [Bacillota bacterium]